MKRYVGLLAVGLFFMLSVNTLAEGRVLVIREAKKSRHTTVAVEAFLEEDILNVKVIARMRRTKPRIYNVIFVGSKVGRVVPDARETLYPTMEGEEPFPTKEREGFISFDDKVKVKEASGTLTKELLKFRIPMDKIVPGKRYQIWVKIESMQRGGDKESFKFNIEDFSQYFSK
ncbi:MAG: hypothetical protein P9M06_03755 [Candidatus Saelkia tenebricola]|nr:hypothetical protein [Candidatus Saelkia tenebricola]